MNRQSPNGLSHIDLTACASFPGGNLPLISSTAFAFIPNFGWSALPSIMIMNVSSSTALSALNMQSEVWISRHGRSVLRQQAQQSREACDVRGRS